MGHKRHVINTMLGWTRDAPFLILWIYFSCLISPIIPAGTLEIRFDQYEVTYKSGVHHDGGDPSSVSMSPDPVWEEITPAPATSNITTTPSPLPPAWQTPPTCTSPARYRFLLCIDRVGEAQECGLGREDTGLTQVSQSLVGPDGEGHDIVMFDNMLRGMPNPLTNPLRYNVPSWPGAIQVTFYVQCCGAEDTERCEEKISGELAVKPVSTQSLQQTRINITNQDGASMVLSVTLRCSQNFYGDNCTTFCRDDNQNRRVCHPETGQLVCRPGFAGPTCEDDVDECKLGVCLHGSTCNNMPGGFTCACLTGSSGRLCQQRITTCDSTPCINGGTCEENLDSVDFRCACPPGWKGKQCQLVDDVTTSTTQEPAAIGHIKDKEDIPTAEPSDDWTIWYVGIALLALTVIVILILIICVVWTSRKRRYHISELAKPDPPIIPVAGVAPVSHFDNMVYLHDPEQIDLQPPTSSLYQRTLVADDPYTNQRPLYQHRIEPDTPFEADDNDTCCGVIRREGGPPARENVYSTWGSLGGPDEAAYESITPQKDEEKKKAGDIPEGSHTYRRESDPVPSTPSRKESDLLFDFTNFNPFETKPPESDIEAPKESDTKDVPSLPKVNYVPYVPDDKAEMSPSYRRESDPVPYFVLEDCQQNYDSVPTLQKDDPSDSSENQMSVENPEYADHRPEFAGPVYPAQTNPFLSNPQEPETDDRRSSVPSVDSNMVGDRRPSAISSVSSMGSNVIGDRRSSAVSSVSSVGSNVIGDRRPSADSNNSSTNSKTSSELSDPYYDSVSPYANTQQLFSQNSTPSIEPVNAPNTSSKKPCPTPRTSIIVPLNSDPEEENSDTEDNRARESPSASNEHLFPRKDSIPEGYSPFSEQRSMIQPKINKPLEDDPVNRTVFIPEYPIPRNNSAPVLVPYRKISIPVVEDPPPDWRKNSEITVPYIGKRRKSGDPLARTTSGSVPTAWPAENSRKKKYSYDLSK